MRKRTREEEGTPICTLGPYQEYPEETVKKLLKGDSFWEASQKVFQQRCEADLMYAILFAPEKMIKLPDGKEIKLVDRIMEAFSNIVAKKNAPSYSKVRRIREANNLLKTDMATNIVKTFNILCMLNREHELQATIRSGFDTKSKYNLFGDECDEHFDEFLRLLHDMVEKTFNWPYNELNVVEMLQNFVYTARSNYLFT